MSTFVVCSRTFMCFRSELHMLNRKRIDPPPQTPREENANEKKSKIQNLIKMTCFLMLAILFCLVWLQDNSKTKHMKLLAILFKCVLNQWNRREWSPATD